MHRIGHATESDRNGYMTDQRWLADAGLGPASRATGESGLLLYPPGLYAIGYQINTVGSCPRFILSGADPGETPGGYFDVCSFWPSAHPAFFTSLAHVASFVCSFSFRRLSNRLGGGIKRPLPGSCPGSGELPWKGVGSWGWRGPARGRRPASTAKLPRASTFSRTASRDEIIVPGSSLMIPRRFLAAAVARVPRASGGTWPGQLRPVGAPPSPAGTSTSGRDATVVRSVSRDVIAAFNQAKENVNAVRGVHARRGTSVEDLRCLVELVSAALALAE